ncbi:MAG: hypothetical protein HDR79_01170 [Bacteroides sp.]|nr:hypothetical protein [Bacteroides sp.]
MKRFLCFGIILLLSVVACLAQFVFQVPVKDALTRHAINAKGKLYLRGDSATTFVTNVFANENSRGILNVIIGADDRQEYVLEIIGTEMVQGDNGRKRMVESDKYDTEWVTLQRTPDMKSPVQYPDVYMNTHRENRLQEVTVTASKVMFYNKGDTLIYNADAFVLAEGSTLDALLEQMPGVELRSNGVIYCDGQRVDNLLLNGKDLFNGKKELMLQNLAAYTVKDIAVYDKSGRRDELMGVDTGDKTHVMDVRLKRQYSNGWILNAEAGCGTHDRYLGKLFGMWFSDNVSVTLFGGANNLSDASTPGAKDGAWSSSQMGEGVSKRENGGFTYFVKGSNDAWELKGNVDALHNAVNKNVTSVRENFLSTGNTFDYLWQNGWNKSFDINTKHTAFAKLGRNANITVTPSFTYRKNNSEGNSVSATFNEKIAAISRSRVQQIYELAPDLVSIMLNRDMREWMSTGKEYKGGIRAKADLKMSNSNLVSLILSGNYNHSESERQNRFEQNEGQIAIPSAKLSQYFKNYPDHTLNLTGRVSYTKYLQCHMIQLPIWYEVHHMAQTQTSELYLLDELAGYAFKETLPSMTQALPELDIYNSYISKERVLEHTVGIAPNHSVGFEVNKDYLFLLCVMQVLRHRIVILNIIREQVV